MKRLKIPLIEVGIAAVIIGLAIWFKLLELAQGIEIILLLGLVFVTAEYARSAHQQAEANKKMAEEMKLARKMQTMPSLTAYFDNPQSSLLDLVIKNIGYGAAKDVRLEIAPPLHDHEDRDIAELSLFKRGIDFFPPSREFRQIVGVGNQFFGEGSQRPLEYNLTVSYCDIEGNPVPRQIIPLDLSVYRNLPIHRESDIDKLTKEVKNLAGKLEAIKPKQT